MSEGPGERSVLGPTQERTAARTHGDSNVLSCSPGDWTELLRYCSCSCLQQLLHWFICSRPAPPPRPAHPPHHLSFFCQSKCTSLAAKSSGHRPSGCSREMPIVLAWTGASQTVQEGTDGTNGRAESNRGTGTAPRRSAIQITVV